MTAITTQQIHEADQGLEAYTGTFAPALARFFRVLVESGMSEEYAIELTSQWFERLLWPTGKEEA
jgi:hypothetical protein